MSLLIVGLIQLIGAFIMRHAPHDSEGERSIATGAFLVCGMMCIITAAFLGVLS